jgi:hypothetical protein
MEFKLKIWMLKNPKFKVKIWNIFLVIQGKQTLTAPNHNFK